MYDLTTLAGNQDCPITPGLWDTPRGEVAKKWEACRTAARAVGDEAERLRVSRTLRQIQAKAERCADQLSPAPEDATEAQRWHTNATLPITRLFNALRSQAIAQEFEEAAILRTTSQAMIQQVEQCTPMTAKQRLVWAALEGEAMTADKLAAKLDCDRGTLITDHLGPLMAAGRIKNSRKVGGYYRPDKLPTTD